MSVCKAGASICPRQIPCGGSTELTLTLDTGCSCLSADIVLVLDRSASMCGEPMRAMKAAALSMIERAAGMGSSSPGCRLPGEIRMAVVSFADRASLDCELTADVGQLRAAVKNLCCGGFTNGEEGLRMARNLLAESGSCRQMILLYTDGLSNMGSGEGIAQAIRRLGIELYCIGPREDRSCLERWSGDCSRCVILEEGCSPEEAFRQVEREMFCSCFRGGTVTVKPAPGFRICRVEPPAWGTAEMGDDGTLCWKLEGGCCSVPDPLCLRAELQHVGQTGGCLPVIGDAVYEDCRGRKLQFPCPRAEVCCCGGITVDPCPDPTCIWLRSCQDRATACAGDTHITGLGRIIQVDTVVRNVCPGKRVAVAVVLTELDDCGREHPRGTRTLLIPAQPGDSCRDVPLRCIQFIVPECLDAVGCGDSLCNARAFRVRVSANYIDTDFICCQSQCLDLTEKP